MIHAAWCLQIDATTADVSLCSRAEEIQQANIPLQLVSGWLDSTAAAAINLYQYCGQAPGASPSHNPYNLIEACCKIIDPVLRTVLQLAEMPVVVVCSTFVAHNNMYIS